MPPNNDQTIRALVLELGRKIDNLDDKLSGRIQKLTATVSDLRVQMADMQVTAARVEMLETSQTRLEDRISRDITSVLEYIKEVDDRVTEVNIQHAQSLAEIHGQRESLDILKAIVVPIVVALTVSVATTLITNGNIPWLDFSQKMCYNYLICKA